MSDNEEHNMQHFEFIDQVLDNCAFDLSYHQKMPFSPNEMEQIYFQQALARIEGAKKLLQVIYLNQQQLEDRIYQLENPKSVRTPTRKKKSIWSKLLGL